MSTHGYEVIPFQDFSGGLNVRDFPDGLNANQCSLLTNMRPTHRGALVTREGIEEFTPNAESTAIDSMTAYQTAAGTSRLVTGAGNTIRVFDNLGSAVATSSAPTANPHYFARFGGPTAEVIYIANGTDTIRKLSGTTFSVPTYTGVTPTGKYVAVTPWDNRLVAANFIGATAGTDPSSVRFSAERVPETFATNDYVDLTPGDGEQITGMIAWRDSLFVFKGSKFFVFYGTGDNPDAPGTPDFLYRAVDTGVGSVGGNTICAGRDGVYFLHQTGVYRTTGGAPELVSGVLDPLFVYGGSGHLSGYYTVPNQANFATGAALAVLDNLLYVSLPFVTTGTTNTFVYSITEGWWAAYYWGATITGQIRAMTTFTVDTTQLYIAGTAPKKVYRQNATLTADVGSGFTCQAMTRPTDAGTPNVKTVREARVWGTGPATSTFGVSKDFVAPGSFNTTTFAFPSTSNLNPTLVRGIATRGSQLAAFISGRPMRVSRIDLHIREVETTTTVQRSP